MTLSKLGKLTWRFPAALAAACCSTARLMLIALISLFASVAPAAAQRSGAAPYGVIEIGSKGVKAYVFDIDYARAVSRCQTDPEAWLACVQPITLRPINVDAIERRNLDAVGDAVLAQKQALMREHRVAEARIYVVGSSGVYAVEHRLVLEEMVNAKVGAGSHRIDFITSNQEASHAFEGLISLLPNSVQELRRSQVLTLDIGSGNTKGSYRDRQTGASPIVNFSIDWGTKKATTVIDSQRNDRDFASYAETFRKEILIPDVRGQFDSRTVAMARPRIYAIGGIVWAVSNLSRPGDRRKFPPLTVADIDAVYAKVTAPNAFALTCSENPDKAINRDIEAICETFTIKNLIAGLQVLKAYGQELDFANKNVFFFRDSQFAWPLGYLEGKLRVR